MHFQIAKSAQRCALSLLVIALPTLLLAQHKNSGGSAPHPSAAPHAAPAQHAPAPSHNAGPTGRPGGNSNMGHPGNSMGNRPNNTMGNRPNNTMGNRPNNTMGNHGGTQMGTHTNTQMGTHANTQMGNRPGNNNMGNRGGVSNNGHGNNAATGHGTNNMSHGAMNNGHNGPGGNRPGGNNMAHGNSMNGGHGNVHAAPGHQVSLRGGGTAHIRPNGQIRSVNRNGMHIEHGMHGGRTVVSTHNGVRVVSVGHRGGYVQRAYVVRGGHSYYSRTYYYHGAYRAGVYRGYYWGGHPYYGYYPAYYYHPVYYGWAYNPWPAPVYYNWGWAPAPWYGYYGPYYAPYPVYPSAYFWLTDYMVAASLQAAYEAQAAANANLMPLTPEPTLVASLMPLAAPDAPKAKMSEEVKKAISEEVKTTLAAEKADAEKPKSTASGSGQQTESKDPPPSLDANFKYFIVSSDLSLEGDGDECGLTQGDVIQRTSEKPDDDSNIEVKVVAATKNDCAIGKEGTVSLDDLTEMYNSFRESLKDGMGELAKKNGTGGLPKAPDTGTTNGDVPAPEPDKSAQKSLQDQQSAADQTETEVKQEAGSSGGGAQ